MKVIVCGAGAIGTSIAQQLVEEDHDVTIIDISDNRINTITGSLDVNAFTGHAAHPEILEKAGIRDIDVIISVTKSDEVNMIISQISHFVFKVPIKIARIRTMQYNREKWKSKIFSQHLPIDLIFSPEREVAKNITSIVDLPEVTEKISIHNDELQILAIKCKYNNPYIGYQISDLKEILENNNIIYICYVRDNKININTKKQFLQENDIIFVMIKSSYIENLLSFFNINILPINKVLIVGGGNIGMHLIHYLEKKFPDIQITIIENDAKRSNYIAHHIVNDNISVIQGNAIDHNILEEAKAENKDMVISLSNSNEINILSCILAKKIGTKKNLALINGNNYDEIISSIDIDIVIDPSNATTSSILRYMKKCDISYAFAISGGHGEVLEIEITSSSSILGLNLSNITMPNHSNIIAIVRNNNIILPNSELIIQQHDTVIIICKASVVKKVEKIFIIKKSFF